MCLPVQYRVYDRESRECIKVGYAEERPESRPQFHNSSHIPRACTAFPWFYITFAGSASPYIKAFRSSCNCHPPSFIFFSLPPPAVLLCWQGCISTEGHVDLHRDWKRRQKGGYDPDPGRRVSPEFISFWLVSRSCSPGDEAATLRLAV